MITMTATANVCAPRHIVKKDGRVIPLEKMCVLQFVAGQGAIALDVRDDNEVEANKGGAAWKDALHVPVNMDGLTQTERPTALEEYVVVLKLAGVLDKPKDTPFIVHCSGGGRASKVVGFLHELGYTKSYNGGNPAAVRQAFEVATTAHHPIEPC